MHHSKSEAGAERASPDRSRSERRGDAASGGRRTGVGALHAAVGNQAVRELHEDGEVQAKLAVGSADDAAEREAERVANVMVDTSGPTPDTEAGVEIRRRANGAGGAVEGRTEARIDTLRSSGSPLPRSVRSYFEPRFGRDFSDVRVHTGPQADAAARSIDAEAFTLGRHVAFASGQYQPETRVGKRLLAHELAHVVQQGGAGGERVQRSIVGQPSAQDVANNWETVEAVGSTVWSVVEDFGLGTERIVESWGVTGFDRSAEIGEENRRAVELIRNLVDAGAEVDGPLYDIVRFTIENDVHRVIESELTPAQTRKIERLAADTSQRAATYIAGRILGMQLLTALATRIASRVAATAAYRSLAKKIGVSAGASSTGIGIPVSATVWLGVLQRASNASHRLEDERPQLYRELRRRDLDMGYFLVEPMASEIEAEVEDTVVQYIERQEVEPSEAEASDEATGESDGTTYREVGGAVVHIVQRGDTLSEIGARHGVDPAVLEELNDVDPRNLQIGEPILVPEPAPLVIY